MLCQEGPFPPGRGGNAFASFSLLFSRESVSCPWSRQCLQFSGGVVLGTGRKWSFQVSAVSPVTPTDLCLVPHLLAACVAPAVIEGQRTVLLFLFMLPGFVFTAVVVEVH